VRRYTTEVVIPLDREIMLQLPPDMPVGRAVIVVLAEEGADVTPLNGTPEDEFSDLLGGNRQDMEWWDEFEDQPAFEH